MATLVDLLNGFVVELRSAGLPVSLTEHIDAMEAVRAIDLADRAALKCALGATLVKNHSHWAAFETVFEVWFSPPSPELVVDGDVRWVADDDVDDLLSQAQETQGAGGASLDGLSADELAAILAKVLLEGDDALSKSLARQAVTRFSGMEPGRPVGGTYYLYRALRGLDFERALARLMDQAEDDTDGGLSDLGRRLARDEFESRIANLRKQIEAEIRRRLVADRGAPAMAKALRKPLPEDIDFMHASKEEMAALTKALIPLTRRLAVRLARRRRHGRKGALDFRRTVRHSLSYGGVPAEPKFRHPRPSKPELFVVADISGSVAAFARFTLMLVYAIGSQFSKVRSFVFIDGIDEVTRFFDGVEDVGQAIHRVNTEADVIWADGHSDYGHAFEHLWTTWGQEIGPRCTVIFLGDARNNYHSSASWVVKEIRAKARHVYWLNPEPQSYWDTGDSIIGQYADHCDGIFECRSLRQLEQFVDRLK